MREIGHFIGGKEVKGGVGALRRRFQPQYWRSAGQGRAGGKSEVEKAIANAEAAFPGWAATNPQRRARVMFKFLELIQSQYDDLARLLSSEHGKTFADSKGDIQRGLEVVEFACGIPHLMKGEYSEGAGPGIDLYSIRQPLGVVAGITPFNFPAMIPLWKFAPAHRLRQCLHPQAVGARSLGADALAELFVEGRTAGGRAQCRQRRQGSGRHAPDRSARQGDRLRRLVGDRRICLRDRHRATANACNASAAPRTT